jgi:predicted transposase YdaD
MYMLVKANSRQVREVMQMSDTAIIDALFVELGAAARWEAKGEAKGKAIWEARGEAIGEVRGEAKGKVIGEAKGKAIGKIEVAKNLKDMGDPVEKIALVTGLSPAEIATL